MSTPVYRISPDLVRDLDATREVMEARLLSLDDPGSVEYTKEFFILRGFNEAVALITNLCHGYNDTAESIRSRLINPEYEGMLDTFEQDEGE